MKVLYDTILKAKYTGRPNRFVVTLDLNGESVLAHLPNPGRMWELLFTGVTMYIVPHDKPDAKTKYRVVGIERDGVVIMLDTNYSNDVAQHLIKINSSLAGKSGALYDENIRLNYMAHHHVLTCSSPMIKVMSFC